jgi:hypothetical protein
MNQGESASFPVRPVVSVANFFPGAGNIVINPVMSPASAHAGCFCKKSFACCPQELEKCRFQLPKQHTDGMVTKRQIIWILLIAVVIGGVMSWVFQPPEPLYQGRTMSYWLNSSAYDIDSNHELSESLWRSFGSNAVPYLRKNLQATDGPIKKAYWAIRRSAFRYLPMRVYRHLAEYNPPPAAIIRWRAADALGYIGPGAAPAIPDLIRLSKTDTSAIMSPGFVRGRALYALGNIGQYLKPTDPLYQAAGEALVAALKDPDPYASSAAANDLKLVFPEAAARAGIK